jgi:thymidylate synthase (FAD)
MKAKLYAYTQPVEDVKKEGMENVQDLIAFCARVSNPANQINSETSEKLIRYLVKHKHWSPLEMASATIEVETTRDIARQLLRHRSFSFQEFSQRYADPAAMGEQFVTRDARWQDRKNRQNSVDFDMAKAFDADISREWHAHQKRVIVVAKAAYEWAVANGIAKEQARAVLPEGNTISRLYVNGTLRSWIHYIDLRSSNGTQKEHMELAREIGKAIAVIFPLAGEFINEA